MVDEIRIESDAQQILERFERLPARVQGAVKRGLARALLLLEEDVKRGADVRFSGSRSGLASRLTSAVETHGERFAVDGVIGFRKTRGFPYELAQEFGARARAGGAMAIPISAEAKALGERGISAQNFPRKLFRPRRHRVLVEAVGRDRIVTHYLFVKSIPPALHFRDSVLGNLARVSREVVKEYEAAQ